jgi:hypothetical protein
MKVMVGLARKDITHSSSVYYQAQAPYNTSWKPALSKYTDENSEKGKEPEKQSF